MVHTPSSPPSPPANEAALHDRLRANPADIEALQLLGKLYLRSSRHEEAEQQLSKALALAPELAEARWLLVGTHVYRGNWRRALDALERLLESDPHKPDYLDVKAFALLHLGEAEAAIASYELLLEGSPTAQHWKSYGHALKAAGRTGEAIAAYRKSLALRPAYGMAWWSLAELKSVPFKPSDADLMRAALAEPDVAPRDQAQIHFALGRTYEDAKQYEASFEHYRQANAVMRSVVKHDADRRSRFVQRNKTVFTPDFFRARGDWGCRQSGPIFIVGLPRSGSTLIEQILASHSQVEPTSELQALENIIRDISRDEQRKALQYPELMQNLSSSEVREAGEKYLARVADYRKLKRPFFIDKMPNNFSYLGTILTALPNAKVIDARRHPLGCGFAIFSHYFADAYSFAFDLADIGRYYRDYVELMAHFDAVQAGRVHRVFYENMVADPEQEIRKLLTYCGLEFEEQCLRFHENRRAVLTPSSEQVRRPIFTNATGLWRHYERWLGPLKSALGDVLGRYPDVPEFPQSVPLMRWRIS